MKRGKKTTPGNEGAGGVSRDTYIVADITELQLAMACGVRSECEDLG